MGPRPGRIATDRASAKSIDKIWRPQRVTIQFETGGAGGRRGAAGSLPAVVAVHGGPGLSHEPLQAFDALARPRGRTVVNYDQRGFGRSSGVVDEVDELTEFSALC